MDRIYKGSLGPKLAADFFAGEQLAGTLQKQEQHLKGLGAQLDANALAAQLTAAGVGFKRSKAIAPSWLRVCHLQPSVSDRSL